MDYGCGHNCSLVRALKVPHKITYQAYDPCVPRFMKPAQPAQMVACIDVLEHVEPELLENVLDDLVRVTEGVLFCTIATGPAMKTLEDGRNAHLIQEPLKWWLPKLWDRFDSQSVQQTMEDGFMVVATAQSHIEDLEGNPIT